MSSDKGPTQHVAKKDPVSAEHERKVEKLFKAVADGDIQMVGSEKSSYRGRREEITCYVPFVFMNLLFPVWEVGSSRVCVSVWESRRKINVLLSSI